MEEPVGHHCPIFVSHVKGEHIPEFSTAPVGCWVHVVGPVRTVPFGQVKLQLLPACRTLVQLPFFACWGTTIMHAVVGFTPGGSVGVGVGGGARLVEKCVGVGVGALAGEPVELAGKLAELADELAGDEGDPADAVLGADATEAAARVFAVTGAAVGLAADGAGKGAAPEPVPVVVGDALTAAGAVAGGGVAMAVTMPLAAFL